MAEMMDNTTYSTKDLYESSFLYTKGCRLADIEREDKVIWFVFDNPEKCDELSRQFWNRRATVNAKEFTDSIKTLKDLIFAKR